MHGHAYPDVNISVDMCRCKIHARDALFAECRAARGRRIGMCGYTAVPEDGLTCLYYLFSGLIVPQSTSTAAAKLISSGDGER